jgi:ligand-binding sensor domain-containing protein
MMYRTLIFGSTMVLLSGCTLDFEKFPSEVSSTGGVDVSVPDSGAMDQDLEPQIDSDADEVLDQNDNCPAVPNTDQLDNDGDGEGDVCDADIDGDRILNEDDLCPLIGDPAQTDADGDGEGDACDDDVDGDGVLNDDDNCPLAVNPDQVDLDRDGQADACDDDLDNDGLTNAEEAVAGTDPRRPDTDADSISDGVDTCPLIVDPSNTNVDGDAYGRVCDADDDNDGVFDYEDNCPGVANPGQEDDNGDHVGNACANDRDGDSVDDGDDNCPYHPNPDQSQQPCQNPLTAYLYDRNIRSFQANGNGVYVVTGESIRWIENGQESLVGSNFLSSESKPNRVFATQDGLLYVAAGAELFVYNPNSKQQFSLMNAPAPESFVAPFSSIAHYNDRVWVGNDRSLFRLESDGWVEVPGLEQVTSLFRVNSITIGPQSRLWVTFDDGVAIFEGDNLLCSDEFPCPTLPEDANHLRGLSRTSDSVMWVYSDVGAEKFNFDAVSLDEFRGSEVFGVAGDEDLWVLSSLNLYRVDGDGRALPSTTAPLPAAEMSSISTLTSGDTLVGSVNGVRQYETFVSNYVDPVRFGACIVDGLRVDEDLWIASRDKVTVIAPDGTERVIGQAEVFDNVMLPQPMEVSVLARVGNSVWVGTNQGIAVINPELLTVIALYQQQIPQAPVTDIVEHPGSGRVWVATRGAGLGYLNNDTTWGTVRASGGLKSDTVFALAVSDTKVYAATQSGINELTEATASVTPNGAFDPLNDLALTLSQDVVFDQPSNTLFVATNNGVAVRRNSSWSLFQRNTGGLPIDSGTDDVRAIAYDGTSLWMVLRRGEAEFLNGSIVKRSPILDGNDAFERFLPAEIGMSPTDSSEQIRINIQAAEISISTCGRVGAGEAPGGLALMPGTTLETARYNQNSLMGTTTDQNRLTIAFDDRPLSTGVSHEGNYVTERVTAQGVVQINLPTHVFSNGPTVCAQDPMSTGRSACIFPRSPIEAPPAGGIGLGSLSNSGVNWSTADAVTFRALRDGDLTDVVFDATGVAWISSRQGLIKYEGGGTLISLLSQATHPELISENISSLATNGTLLALGTDVGVVRFNPSALSDDAQWAQPTGVPEKFAQIPISAMSFADDGTLYYGTDAGVFVLSEDLSFQRVLTIADGLASNVINDLVVRASGEVYIASGGGLNVFNPADNRVRLITYGTVLGGSAVFDLSLSVSDELWFRTQSGIGHLD